MSASHKAHVPPEELIEYYYTNVKRQPLSHPYVFLHSLFHIFRLRGELLLEKYASNIRCPTLIVQGSDDPLLPLAKTKDFINKFPQTRLVIIKEAGHAPPVEQSAEFNKVVVKYLLSSP